MTRKTIDACVRLLMFGLALGSGSVLAVTMNLPHSDRGWYDETGFHDPGNPNYITGDGRGPACAGCSFGDARSFYVFNLAGVPTTIDSAKLALFLPGRSPAGFASGDPSETFELHDVTTLIGTLVGGGGGVAAHGDLGAGVVYGSRAITANDMGSTGAVVEIDLNASALAALNSTHGLFAFGASITTLDNVANDEYAFGWTNNGSELTELRLTLVPEPGSALLFVTAIFGYSLRRERTVWRNISRV